ncbi:MAG: peptidylprolyl isomerase [Rhodomicrobium sp.]|jgi:peptidylprolyl isomerase
MVRSIFLARLLVTVGLLITAAFGARAASPDNTLYMDLKDGRVVIELRPDLAPKHVQRIKKLVKEGFYDGLTFHRVITGFMAQTGDPKGDGTGGSKYPDLPAEFTPTPFKRGTVGAARSGNPNSANSQFFICLEDASHLNGNYTVWGQVTEGMQLIDRIKKGAGASGQVFNPDKILKMQLASDAR